MSVLGGQIICSSFRETVIHESSHFHDTTLSLTSDSEAVQNTSFLPELEVQCGSESPVLFPSPIDECVVFALVLECGDVSGV
jgi:hypothetical protein